MADFTTWAALKTAVLNDLSNGSVYTKAYSIGGRSRTFQSLREIMDFIALCDMHTTAVEEHGRETFVQFERPTSGIR